MPDIKVYIRQANLEKWNAIANKSAWINTLLENTEDTSSYGRTVGTPVGPAVTVLAETIPGVVKGAQGLEFCPHGFGKGSCKKDDCNRKYR